MLQLAVPRSMLHRHLQRKNGGPRLGKDKLIEGLPGLPFGILDRRIGRTVDSDGAGPLAPVRVTTLYDGEHAWADYNQSGVVQTRYLYGDKTDQILARWNATNGTAWYLTDHLGTVRDLASRRP